MVILKTNWASKCSVFEGKDDVISAVDVLPQLKELYRRENKVTNIHFVIEIKDCPTKLAVSDTASLYCSRYRRCSSNSAKSSF